MATSKLPRTITKLDLLEEAQRRFHKWVDMYADSSVSDEQMYEDMSCSSYSGDPAFDFLDDAKAKRDSVIRYQYKDGSCYFIVDGIEVEVFNLRSMHESSRIGKEAYVDVCILTIRYTDTDNDNYGSYIYHVIPNTWLYRSASEEFDEGAEVHKEFINAARAYIKEHNITKEMQEVQ